MNTIAQEKRTVEAMIRIYCNSVHLRKTLCDECNTLLLYSEKRTDKCKFGNEKPACKDCTVHCYSPEMKKKIQEVMRFSGPRMIYKHPLMAISHLFGKHYPGLTTTGSSGQNRDI